MNEYFVTHTFGMNDTIHAVMKHINGYEISKIDMDDLMAKYNELNGIGVPHPGQVVKIPLLVKV